MNVCECLYLTSFIVNPFQMHLVWWFLLHAFWMRNENLNCLCKRINEYSQGHLFLRETVEKFSKDVMDNLLRNTITRIYFLFLQQGGKHFSKHFSNHHPPIHSSIHHVMCHYFCCQHLLVFTQHVFCVLFVLRYFSKAINWIFFERYEDDIQWWCWHKKNIERKR